jgi:hypothetical protein
LHYRDNHGSYPYTFFSDGRYRFASFIKAGLGRIAVRAATAISSPPQAKRR